MLPAILTLVQIGCVIAAIIFRAADRHLEQGVARVIEKITVMGNNDCRAIPLCQITFQPFDSFDIEMIGRLVEQQQIGVRQQETRQMRTRTLTAGEMIERHVIIGFIEAQAGEHLFDLDFIDVAAAPLELMLYASIPRQGLFPFHGVGHFAFEFSQFPLHADQLRERLETNIP